jgi:hypothetical protein
MKYEILSIDRLDEHEKLIRENGALREERNRLEARYDKHMQYAIRNNAIIFDLRDLREKARNLLESRRKDLPRDFYYEMQSYLEEEI